MADSRRGQGEIISTFLIVVIVAVSVFICFFLLRGGIKEHKHMLTFNVVKSEFSYTSPEGYLENEEVNFTLIPKLSCSGCEVLSNLSFKIYLGNSFIGETDSKRNFSFTRNVNKQESEIIIRECHEEDCFQIQSYPFLVLSSMDIFEIDNKKSNKSFSFWNLIVSNSFSLISIIFSFGSLILVYLTFKYQRENKMLVAENKKLKGKLKVQ